jgi:hypothetical protein
MDSIALGIDRIQRNFKPLTDQVEAWKQNQLTDDRAKAVIFDAFIGKKLDAPQHIAKLVSMHYFEPQYKEFEPRTTWSLQNAFTSVVCTVLEKLVLAHRSLCMPFASCWAIKRSFAAPRLTTFFLPSISQSRIRFCAASQFARSKD